MLHEFIDDHRFRLWCGTCGWLVYQLSTTCLWESWPHVELYQSFRAVPQRWKVEREAGGAAKGLTWDEALSAFILFHLEGIPILGAPLAWNLGHFSGVHTLKLTKTGFIDPGIITQFTPLFKIRMSIRTFQHSPIRGKALELQRLYSFDLKLGSWCQETARWSMDILIRGQSNDHQSGNIPINVAWTHPFFTWRLFPGTI